MPKQKTHKGCKARFKVTKSGKVKRHSAGIRHLMTGESPKTKRKLRRATLVSPADTKKIRIMLGK